jgi:hypothetical protein
MPTIYGPLDIVKNEIRNAVVQNLGTAPASPVKGLIYFNTTDNTVYWYDGTQWIAAKAAAGAIPSDTVTTAAIGDAAVPGASTVYSRGDHKHGMPAFAATTTEQTFGSAPTSGVAATLARSDHAHGNPTHDNAAHSTIPLSALAVPTADVSFGGFKLTNLYANPTAQADAVPKSYVDNLVMGLGWKDTCRVATTANMTYPFSGLPTIDGVAVAMSDRVLVKDQTAPAQNGIWMASSSTWNRTTDADAETELLNASVWIAEGTVNADTAWVLTNNAPINVGTTGLTWVQFSGGGMVNGGAGLTKTGNTLDVGAGVGITVAADTVAVDQTVIASRSYVDTAVAPMLTTAGAGLTKTGATVDVGGGTGITVAADSIAVDTAVIATKAYVDAADAAAITTAGAGLTKTGATVDVIGGTGITVAPDLVSVDTTVIATKSYADSLVVGVTKKAVQPLTGTASPETITHNLNTRDVHVQVVNGSSPFSAVEVDWDATTVNTVTVRYNPNLGAGYRAVVIG